MKTAPAVAWTGIVLALSLLGGPLHGEPDDAQQAWSEAVKVTPFWDNVQDDLGWVAGQRPQRRVGGSLHTVRLGSGEHTTVRLPAGEALRVHALQGALDEAGLELAWSNGSGLFAGLTPQVAGDGRSLIARPPRRAEALLRVHRRAEAATTTELALFFSRDPNREVVTSYRALLTPRAAGPRQRLDDGNGRRDFWLSDRDQPFELAYQGPTRVRLDSRLLFPDEDGPYADSYRISAYVNGEPLREIHLATLLETGAAVALDGCRRPLGRPAYAYLDLPQGPGVLELRVRRPMLLRALAAHPPDDYLLSGNAPLAAPRAARPASLVYQQAVQDARDNARPQGGSSALGVLEALARQHPAQAQYRSLVARRGMLHAFYRELMPQQHAGDGAPLFAWFGTPRPTDGHSDLYLPEAYLEGLAANLASGVFHALPRQAAQALTYRIPERLPSSELRVAVDLAGVADRQALYLQLDDAPPLRLELDAQRPVLDPRLRPNTAALALALTEQRGDQTAGTLSGAFGARRTPAPLLDVAFLEIPLERPVERLRLWRGDDAQGPLRAALAYRSSGWFQLPESGYLGLLASLGEAQVQAKLRGLLAGLAGSGGPAGLSHAAGHNADERELHNQWMPLLRLLHARYAMFAAAVEGPAEAVPAGRADAPAPGQIMQQAQAAETAGDWLTALQHWTTLQRLTGGKPGLEARSRQVEALMRLGSGFLAQQLLRQDLLYATEPAQRDQAARRLLALAEAEQDSDAMLSVRAVAALRDPSTGRLQALAAALAADGQERFALQLLLAIPAAQRPAPLVLELAYGLRWWGLFDATLAGLEDAGQQALWRGYRSQLRGDFDAALRHWEDAGQRGHALAVHLAAGLDIRRVLSGPRSEERRRALLDWEDWQHAYRGPRLWRDAGHAVTGHAGTRTLLSVARGEYATLFRATPGAPLRLAVYGPTRLRLGVRPLHEGAGDERISDWLSVHAADGVRRHPIIDNSVSPGLRLPADDRRRPGQQLELVQQVPAGYHEFALSAAQHELLVSVAVEGPRLPLTVLPALNPYTAQWGLATKDRSVPADLALPAQTVAVALVGRCRVQPAAALPAVTAAGSASAPPSAAWFDGLEVLRAGRPSPAARAAPAPSLSERLASLLWEAEQAPQRHAALLAQAEQLVEGASPAAGAEPILRRLRRTASWELLHTVQESAGLRLVEFSGWQPESPVLQIRKAVMALDAADEQLVSGHEARVLSLYNRQPVVIGLHLSVVEAALQPAQPMRVLLSWDDREPRELLLDAATPELRLEERVGGGHHVLRLQIAEPLANQFLRIRLEERRGAITRVIAEPVQRSYMLATPEQPLVLLARGPTRLRIDEWRDGQTRVSYRNVAEGWQRVEVAVEKGRDEALLRVFSRSLEPGRPSAELRRMAYRPEPLAPPLWPQLPAIDLAEAAAIAPQAAGWPGDGTWSANLGFTGRRTVDDEPQTDGAVERFATLGASYRWFSEEQYSNYQVDGALRLHEEGDPTLALGGSVSVHRPDWPFDLALSGSLFLQRIDAAGGVASAATLRARVSRRLPLTEKLSHRPSLAVFQRWLSLDEPPLEAPEKVDQDIFTRYKRDHSRGLRAGERIDYRPWLDTLLYAGVELVSNEDLNLFVPDHLKLSLGARQLVGDLDLGLRYNHYEFFADDDRARASDTQRLRLDAGFGRWLSPRRGLQAGLALEYDPEADDVSAFLSLSLHLANGRYYRDFRPGEQDFRPLRQRRTLERHVREGWQ